jgi:hypothetical protein
MKILLFCSLAISFSSHADTRAQVVEKYCENARKFSKVPPGRHPKILYMAGIQGAGKSTVRKFIVNFLGDERYFHVDPDEIREHLDAYKEWMAKNEPPLLNKRPRPTPWGPKMRSWIALQDRGSISVPTGPS